MFDYQCFTKFKSAQKRCIGLYTVDSFLNFLIFILSLHFKYKMEKTF